MTTSARADVIVFSDRADDPGTESPYQSLWTSAGSGDAAQIPLPYKNTDVFPLCATDGDPLGVPDDGCSVGSPKVAADGSFVAFATKSGDLYTSKLDGTDIQKLTNTQKTSQSRTCYNVFGACGLEWFTPTDVSPDGDWIIGEYRYQPASGSLRSPGQIFKVHPDGSGMTFVSVGSQINLQDPHFSPGGSRIYYRSNWTPEGATLMGSGGCCMWTDGDGIWSATPGGEDPYLVSFRASSEALYRNFTVAPTGSLLADEDRSPYGFWHMDQSGLTEEIHSFTPPPGREYQDPDFSPSGQRLLAIGRTSVNSNFTDLTVMNADGSGAQVIHTSAEGVTITADFGNGKAPDRDPKPLTDSETYGGQNPAVATPSCNEGDYPVNCRTGNFWHTFEDVAVPGRGPALRLERTYNALDAGKDGPFGYGWSSSYAMRLDRNPISGTVTVIQENGSTIVFESDSAGNYIAPGQVDAKLVHVASGGYELTRNRKERFTFEEGGRLARVADLNGNVTRINYNADKLSYITDPSGRTLQFEYGPAGRVSRVIDPGGRDVLYGYNASGELTSVRDTGGGTTTFTYDTSHRVKTMTDATGGTVTNTYDSQGRVIAQSDPLERVTTYDFTPTQTTITSPRGVKTVQEYNSFNLVTRLTRASGTSDAAVWEFEYDPKSLAMTSLKDPKGRVTTWQRDQFGQATKFTDSSGSSTQVDYGRLGSPTSVRGPDGVEQRFKYDWLGNLLSQTTIDKNGAVGRTVTFRRDDPAHPDDVTRKTDPRGKVSTFTYDGAGNLRSTADPTGRTTTATYNALGQVTSSVPARGNAPGADPARFTSTFEYDGAGHVIRETDPLGRVFAKTFDLSGRLKTSTDAKGRQTTYYYDLAGQLRSVGRPDNSSISVDYDPDGNVLTRTNAAGRATRYTYDPLGRKLTEEDPTQRVTRYTYDSVGNLATSLSARGETTSFAYDASNRPLDVTYSQGTTAPASFKYDAAGQLTEMTDGSGTTSYAYDALSRLQQVVTGAGKAVSYKYDAADNVTEIVYPNGRSVLNEYDDADRLASTADWNNRKTTFEYDAGGAFARTVFPNGTTSTRERDAVGRVSSITHARGATPLAGLTYTRDELGRTTGTSSTGLGDTAHAYGYSDLGQLKSDAGVNYDYDRAGNPTVVGSASIAYDAADQIQTITRGQAVTPVSYDASGNRLIGSTTTDASAKYSYDGAERLKRVRFGTGSLETSGLLAAGSTHSLALKKDGSVVAWGGNASGQLGNNTTVTAKSAVPVTGLTAVASVAAGDSHSIALRDDGTVATWGLNSSGQLGNASTVTSKVPVTVPGLAGVEAVAAGGTSSYAVRDDGKLAAWGGNSSGQLGNNSTTNATQPIVVAQLSGVKSVAAGTSHAIALTGAGTVWTWGNNASGQLGTGSTATRSTVPVRVTALSDIVAVAAGGTTSYALDRSGKVWAWGDNAYGQLGNGSTAAKSNVPVATAVTGAERIAAGLSHALAVTSTGTVTAWGRNNSGQLGDSQACGKQYCANPVSTKNLTAVVAVAAGATHSLASTTAGNVSAWGANASGQLGNNTTTTSTAPVQLAAPTSVAPGDSPSYTFNAAGLRTTTTVGGTRTQFTYDVAAPLPLLLEQGSLSFLYGPDGQPVSQIDAAGATLYFHSDESGSTRMLTDVAGSVAATFSYDAYGSTVARTGAASTPLLWQGQLRDEDSGLYYLRARFYDPRTAQFLTRDPLESATGRPYMYAGGDPINDTDPSGLLSLNDAMTFVSEGAAGALDALTFGGSTKLAGHVFGFDRACADWGAGFTAGQVVGTVGPVVGAAVRVGVRVVVVGGREAWRKIGPKLADESGFARLTKTQWGWTGGKAWRDAVKQIDTPGTHTDVVGRTPTPDEARMLIDDAGGKIIRDNEPPHLDGKNPHSYPHINYETSSGQRATVKIG